MLPKSIHFASTVPHTVLQVPELKIWVLWMSSLSGPSFAQALACIQTLRRAAQLFAAVPSLVISEPGNSYARGRSFVLEDWPLGAFPSCSELLSVSLWDAFEPLASDMGNLSLYGVLLFF